MIYRTFGQTGKVVSAVGFGGMRFDTTKTDAQNAQLILYAYENGINFFDTAPGYSDDRSVHIYSLAFKELSDQRDKFYVCTKAMPEKFDTAAKARDAVNRSLERMGLEWIDFFYVWCVRKMEHYSLAMMQGGEYEGLLQARQQGLIRHICISSHLQGEQIKTILSNQEFDGVLLGVNILNFPYRWSGVDYAHKQSIGVVAMNPLAGGVIPANEESLGFLCEYDKTPTMAALRFCLSCPQITVTLNGFTTKEHIDMACEVADRCREFTAEQIEEVRGRVSEQMNNLCTGCGYCLKQCPKKIPIASYMQVYNEMLFKGNDIDMPKRLKGQREWGMLVERYADADQCLRCHQCEEACTQHLDIMDRLTRIADWERQMPAG